MKCITVQMLKENNVCSSQVKLFKETFGDSVDVTMVSSEDVSKLDINRCAELLLSDKLFDEYWKQERKLMSALSEEGHELDVKHIVLDNKNSFVEIIDNETYVRCLKIIDKTYELRRASLFIRLFLEQHVTEGHNE